MSSRDLWIRAGSGSARDLLSSLLAARLLGESSKDPLYVASPYLTDFPLFQNQIGQYRALFFRNSEMGEQTEITFSDALIELASRGPVRILTVPGENADPFVSRLLRFKTPGISVRFLADPYHAKGLACSSFFVEGSMNFTYSGLYRRDEKITANSRDSDTGKQKIDLALLELKRMWQSCMKTEIGDKSS